MNEETMMFYDPTLGKMLAVGTKEEITSIANEYMESLKFALELREAQKKHKELQDGIV
jgi:hypothetical protein